MIDVVVPCLNEEGSIALFLKTLKKELRNNNFRLILVDDSSDNTAVIARKECKALHINSLIIKRRGEKGKGNAVMRGLKELKASISVIIDADMEYHPKYILPMVKKLKFYDFVQSVRVRKTKWYRRIGGLLFNFFVFLLFGIAFDTQSGLKVFRTECVKNIILKNKGWVFDVELIYKVRKSGFRIATYTIVQTVRRKGESKINIFTPIGMLYDLVMLRLKI
ncbi:hypothetical protein COX58_03140 [archaeon CG_4_10_14_0_2_um_filter_Archaea_38_6]|nr:MAG: hypothetical protein COS83_03600 [archaeon CG07_land_8_20_14_0_80_38_8]PIU89551.1 MAG: hypothetical protein COS64_00500 [archaeon CG06_land_8_20_14_3_00_37_11]PJA21914.1 MAG: hypothetical protein COX58_03140 [archaeon CG_4_10_14_0_2_um_filter_Archaea_38_6]